MTKAQQTLKEDIEEINDDTTIEKVCFLNDLQSSENAELIFWHNEMLKNNMPGAVEDIKTEMVRRFLLTDWSYIEELYTEKEKENRINMNSKGENA